MKKLLLLLGCIALLGGYIHANGVAFKKSETGQYLTLLESTVEVAIENQVASTKSTQIFKNQLSGLESLKYAFPLPENASATMLRYKIGDTWYKASFAAVPQDTTTGGEPGEIDFNLKEYLGVNPLYYDIDMGLLIDSIIVVELSYVELLPYKFGVVNYKHKNDYQAIQQEMLIKQGFSLNLNSGRTIEDIGILNLEASELTNTGETASVSYELHEQPAIVDYEVYYRLSLDELGLFSLSTYMADSLKKDDFGRGFFSFIVEPDPSETSDVIEKVFTLIIDRSGSMDGDKIIQARDAANFIIENLNAGDKFNVISFASEVTSFRTEHVEYSNSNASAAISYINAINSSGSTNISGAFDVAVPQFKVADDNAANIIIFFTDGQQSAGIENTEELIKHINNLIVQSEKRMSLFTFGIGPSTNERLLTSLASANNGMAEFLNDEDLEAVITDFYLMIRNPVLLNIAIEFSPSIIKEVYPKRLPNLYKGQQMILVGRYDEYADLETRLSGIAYSNNVEYNYTTHLSDSMNVQLQFLSKIWAKSKIEYLVEQYNLVTNNPERSDSIKNVVIDLSLSYGVVSPFTSFQGGDEEEDWTGGGTVGIEEELVEFDESSSSSLSNVYFKIDKVYPNPCHDFVNLRVETKENALGTMEFSFINAMGQLVLQSVRNIIPNTEFSFDFNLSLLSPGVYYVMIKYNGESLAVKLVVE